MRKIFALFAFIFIILSCISAPPINYTHNIPLPSSKIIPIQVDKTFSIDEMSYIEAAISEWNLVLNESITLKIVSKNFDMEPEIITQTLNNHGYIFLNLNSDSYLVPDTNPFEKTLAFTNDLGGNFLYIISDRINYQNFKSITLHEIGHLLGANHSSRGLMSPQFDSDEFRCVDFNTVEQIAVYNNLKIDHLNYCH